MRAAAAAEHRTALGLILASTSRPAGEREITEFMRIAAQRGIDLGRLMVAESGGRLAWALLPIPTPGRTLLLLAPNHLLDGPRLEPAQALTEAACREYASCQLAQVLVEPASAAVRSMYLCVGFTEIAELIYLHAQVKRPKAAPILPAGFRFENYSPVIHTLFARAIRASYQQSLDCPALNGLRDIEDVILGHQAAGGLGSGEFDPSLWRVLLQQKPAETEPEPCGVLLLCRTDQNEAMELVYIGLAPHIRRHGLGGLMVRQAFMTAADDNRRRLTLAVDSRNIPALHLYYRHGFQKVGSKVAFIRDLRGASLS